MKQLKTFLGGARRATVELAAFSVVVNLLLLVMPLYMLQVYDRVLTSASPDTLLFLSVIAGAALVLLGIVEAVRGIYAARLGSRLEKRMGRGALLATLHGPRAALGDVQTLRDMQQVRGFLSGRTVFALFDVPFAPLFIAFLYFVHPALFWLTLVGAVALAAIALLNQRSTAGANKDSGDASISANLAAQSLARSHESLTAMGMVDNVVRTWGQSEAKSLEAQDRATRINSWFTGLSRTVRMGLQVAVLGYGAALVLRGEMTAGMIFAASIISGRALQPIDQVIGGWRSFVDVGRAWDRLKQAVAPFENERVPTEQADPVGRLELENVVYGVQLPGQSQGKAIIKRITGGIRPGEMIGMIGPSGAGKSTLLRLMVGAIAPSQGTVRLDGGDLRNWPLAQRGRHFGYLSQDVELLPGTVAENISRFDATATPEEVREAATRSGVTALVQGLPMGFDTPIGPGGHALSGGERQRIGLARAFFRMPRILVLDEPNAALDDAGSAALEGALKSAREAGCTVIVAAQRREILRHVDKVMVVEDGQVAKFDTVQEVGRWMQERAAQQGGNVSQLAARDTREADRAESGPEAASGPSGGTQVGQAPPSPKRIRVDEVGSAAPGKLTDTSDAKASKAEPRKLNGTQRKQFREHVQAEPAQSSGPEDTPPSMNSAGDPALARPGNGALPPSPEDDGAATAEKAGTQSGMGAIGSFSMGTTQTNGASFAPTLRVRGTLEEDTEPTPSEDGAEAEERSA